MTPWNDEPLDYSQPGSSVHGDSLSKNTGVVDMSSSRNLPDQGWSLGLLYCKWTLYCLSYQLLIKWVVKYTEDE